MAAEGSCYSERRRRVVAIQVAFGTNDFTSEPAMSPEQLDAAMEAGRAAVNSLHGDGIRAICLGELGIGNTTSAAALLAAVTYPRP